jgi:hypothetical protein
MCGNGVLIGMVVTQVHHRITHRDQAVAVVAFFAAAIGAATTTAVGLPIVAGTGRPTGSTITAFVWFFRRTPSSPLSPNSAIAEFENFLKILKMKKLEKTDELLIIQKLYDYLVWVSPIINRLPRDKKFTIGDRLLNRLYDVLEDLIKAKYRSRKKIELLEQANVGLEITRFYQRLILSDNLWNRKRYEFASKSVNDIGRLLGKWAIQVKVRNEKSR